eukprot:1157224-Pelagomonas_calceolata.AAC.2
MPVKHAVPKSTHMQRPSLQRMHAKHAEPKSWGTFCGTVGRDKCDVLKKKCPYRAAKKRAQANRPKLCWMVGSSP